MAIKASVTKRTAVEDDGIVVIFEILLIDADAFPPVEYRSHKAIYEIGVDFFVCNGVCDGLVLLPTALGVISVDV